MFPSRSKDSFITEAQGTQHGRAATKEKMKIIQEIHRRSTTVLLVEQNASMSLTTARRGYILENGRIILEGPAQSLLEDEKVKKAYLGL